MTITSELNRVVYSGNGSTLQFSYPYYYSDKAHIVAVLVDVDGAESILVLNTDYTLTTPSPSGGTLTMVTAPATGEQLAIYREVPATQEFNPEEGGALPADTLEAVLDKLTCLAQQLTDKVNRSIVLSPASPYSELRIPDPEATKFLRWNDAGNALMNGGTADQIENAQYYAEVAQNAANNLTCNRYEETVTESKSAFTLPFSILPANSNIAVIVNGIWQPPSAYTIVDETHVTLGEAVPIGTNVNFISMNIPGLSSIQGKMDLPTVKVAGNVVEMTSLGHGANSGFSAISLKAGRRNFLINGNMKVWQRATSASVTGTIAICAPDRWRLVASGATVTAVRLALLRDYFSEGDGYFLSVQGATSNTLFEMHQRIESVNAAQLASKTLCLSCVFYDSAGGALPTAYFGIPTTTDGFGTCNWSAGIPMTLIRSEGGFKLCYVTYPIGDCKNGLEIAFTTGATVLSQTKAFGRVQLEIGGYPTDLEFRHISEEELLCRRYFEKIAYNNGGKISLGQAFTTGSGSGSIIYHPKRPGASVASFAGTIIALTAGGADATGSIAAVIASDNSMNWNLTGATGLVAGNATTLIANGAGCSLTIDAEL